MPCDESRNRGSAEEVRSRHASRSEAAQWCPPALCLDAMPKVGVDVLSSCPVLTDLTVLGSSAKRTLSGPSVGPSYNKKHLDPLENAQQMPRKRRRGAPRALKRLLEKCSPTCSPPDGTQEIRWEHVRTILEQISWGHFWTGDGGKLRCGPNLGLLWSTIGPILARSGPNWPDLDQPWSNSGPNWPRFAAGARNMFQQRPCELFSITF